MKLAVRVEVPTSVELVRGTALEDWYAGHLPAGWAAGTVVLDDFHALVLVDGTTCFGRYGLGVYRSWEDVMRGRYI